MKNLEEKELKHVINRYLKKLGIRIDIVGFKYLAVMLKEKIIRILVAVFMQT